MVYSQKYKKKKSHFFLGSIIGAILVLGILAGALFVPYVQTNIANILVDKSTIYQDVVASVESLTAQKEENENMISSLEQTVTQKTNQITTLNSNISTLISQKNQLVNELNDELENVSILSDTIDELNDEIVFLNEWADMLENELEIETENKQEIELQLEEVNSQLTSKLLEIKDLQNDLDTLNDDIDDLENRIDMYENEIVNQSSLITLLQNEIDRLNTDILDYEEMVRELFDEITILETKIDEFESGLINFEIENVPMASVYLQKAGVASTEVQQGNVNSIMLKNIIDLVTDDTFAIGFQTYTKSIISCDSFTTETILDDAKWIDVNEPGYPCEITINYYDCHGNAVDTDYLDDSFNFEYYYTGYIDFDYEMYNEDHVKSIAIAITFADDITVTTFTFNNSDVEHKIMYRSTPMGDGATIVLDDIMNISYENTFSGYRTYDFTIDDEPFILIYNENGDIGIVSEDLETFYNADVLEEFLSITQSATLSFSDVNNRTHFDSDVQKWKQNGVTLKNERAYGSTAIGDFYDPIRLYAKSSVTISCDNEFKKILINKGSKPSGGIDEITQYLKDSLPTMDFEVELVENNSYLLTLEDYTNSFTFEKLSTQFQIKSITVYFV